MRRIAPLLLVFAACSSDAGPATTLAAESTTTVPVTTSSTSATSTSEPTTTTFPAATTTLLPLQSLAYEPVADGLPFPVQITAADGSVVSYVVTKDGSIWPLLGDGVHDDPVLDISERVRNSGEQGLLAMALHPTDPGRMFVHYSGSGGKTVVSEFTMTSPMSADPESEKVLLEVSQPAANHNGGMIQFDSNGYLFVGLGDGGGANDTFGNGQNQGTLLGGLVRIDVDSGESALFDYGLRNPWRFWIDGDLIYIADVGQNTYEEISIVELEEGANFGWPITEGLHCFRPSSGCDTDGLTLPVIEVRHGDAGTCSITGGLVYRGSQIPELVGEFFYSDYCGGYLRSLRFVDGGVESEADWTDQVGVPGQVTGFGHDGLGEIYVMTTSELFRIVAIR